MTGKRRSRSWCGARMMYIIYIILGLHSQRVHFSLTKDLNNKMIDVHHLSEPQQKQLDFDTCDLVYSTIVEVIYI